MTRRIVHVLHHSPSLLHDEPLEALLTRTAWHLEVARQQQRYIHGVDVECWTPERRVSRVVRGEQHGIKNLFFPSYALGYQRELSPSLFEHLEYNVGRISALFLHGSVSYLSALLLRKFGDRVPIVIQNHGETSTLTRSARPGAKKPLDYHFRVRLEQSGFAKAQRILCLNPANITDYERNGVPSAQLSLSSMGVDVSTFVPLAASKASLRSALGLPARKTMLGFVGRLASEKRVNRVLHAMQELPNDVGLLVIGDGPLRASLTERAQSLGGRVRFLGNVSDRQRLNQLYNAFDLLLLPSDTEGFPMALVEALAAGTPALASDLPGTRALLADGTCGALWNSDSNDLAKAIQLALSRSYDSQLLQQRASRHSWQSVCEAHARILSQLWAQPARVA